MYYVGWDYLSDGWNFKGPGLFVITRRTASQCYVSTFASNPFWNQKSKKKKKDKNILNELNTQREIFWDRHFFQSIKWGVSSCIANVNENGATALFTFLSNWTIPMVSFFPLSFCVKWCGRFLFPRYQQKHEAAFLWCKACLLLPEVKWFIIPGILSARWCMRPRFLNEKWCLKQCVPSVKATGCYLGFLLSTMMHEAQFFWYLMMHGAPLL